MNTNSIKFKVIFTIILSLAIGAFAIIALLNKSYENNINLIAEESIKISEEAFINLEKNDTNMLSSTLEALLENDEYKQLFKEKNFEKLYEVTSPLFNSLKERYRITHWYFHNPEPDSTNFLRVHNKGKNGDVIKRVTYVNSAQSKAFASGKELGKTAFALRVVHPYYDQDELLGYLELGQEIDHFLGIMKEQTGNDYGLLIKKEFLDEKEWESVRASKNLPNNWADQEDVLVVDKTTDDENLMEFEGDIESIPDGGLVLEEINQGDSVFVRGIFPIYDAANKKVGGVFVLHDITSLYNEMKAMQTKAIALIVALMIIISAVIIVMFNKLIITRLNNMIEVATRVVGGDYNTKIIPSANDEIGKFESLFEQFRTVFVSLVDELSSNDKNDSER